MGYPFSNAFEQEPPAAYTTPLGSMSASYNRAAQAIDLSAPNGQSILRINEAAHGDFWFEADLELLTDPSGRKHVGLWMTTGNGAEGFRFAHLDGGWSVSRWNSGFGDGAGVTGVINDGVKPLAGMADAAPGFNVGERRTLRCEVITGAFDANGVPWSRLMQFRVDDVLLFQVSDASYRGKLVPGLFLYGATAWVYGIAGGTPSGLPAFPNAVGVNADTDLGHLAGGSTSVLPDQASDSAQNIRVQPQLDLTRLNSPASAHWNRVGMTCNGEPFPMPRRTFTLVAQALSRAPSKKKAHLTTPWYDACNSIQKTPSPWWPKPGRKPMAATALTCLIPRSATAPLPGTGSICTGR